jgi:hypothetical protein
VERMAARAWCQPPRGATPGPSSSLVSRPDARAGPGRHGARTSDGAVDQRPACPVEAIDTHRFSDGRIGLFDPGLELVRRLPLADGRPCRCARTNVHARSRLRGLDRWLTKHKAPY